MRSALGESARFVSADGTVRYLFALNDGKTVEAVLIPKAGRDTICISSQVGCAIDCKFCLTALIGLERNLTADEIAGQVLHVIERHELRSKERPLSVVLMGQGEPLMNLDNVLEATRILVDQKGASIAERRISVSTSGLTPKIEELGRAKIRPHLAVSLNASHEEQRRAIMPITNKWSLEGLLDACRAFPLRRGERLLFEYVLLDGVNDSDEDARRVVDLLLDIPCTVNLIAWNPAPGLPFRAPTVERVLSFQKIVMEKIPCYYRRARGADIYAACGQLKVMETPGLLQIQP